MDDRNIERGYIAITLAINGVCCLALNALCAWLINMKSAAVGVTALPIAIDALITGICICVPVALFTSPGALDTARRGILTDRCAPCLARSPQKPLTFGLTLWPVFAAGLFLPQWAAYAAIGIVKAPLGVYVTVKALLSGAAGVLAAWLTVCRFSCAGPAAQRTLQ